MSKCSQHPDAPHGFVRNSSHSTGEYVCECEGWEPADTIKSLQADLEEQCRLNGMGSEREAQLIARVEELERAARMALEALIYCEALNSDVERQKIEAVNDLREMLGEKK